MLEQDDTVHFMVLIQSGVGMKIFKPVMQNSNRLLSVNFYLYGFHTCCVAIQIYFIGLPSTQQISKWQNVNNLLAHSNTGFYMCYCYISYHEMFRS
jgi:hypothetical protein